MLHEALAAFRKLPNYKTVQYFLNDRFLSAKQYVQWMTFTTSAATFRWSGVHVIS